MENKINIAELLKDCPQGMELDCTMVDDVTFYGIGNEETIVVKRELVNLKLYLDRYGAPVVFPKEDLKCVIFPKGKTSWEGFVPPCKFKDGDIVANQIGKPFILKSYDLLKNNVCSYCGISCWDNFELSSEYWTCARDIRLATEEEKAKLFETIKAKGYKWDEETKTLVKLIEKPKFKVGDKIVKKNSACAPMLITTVSNEFYYSNTESSVGALAISEQDNYELVPNKFDINTLIPFESKVLVRSYNDDIWRPAIYGFTDSDRYYVVGGVYWEQCIPYEVNKELLGTTNNPKEYEIE